MVRQSKETHFRWQLLPSFFCLFVCDQHLSEHPTLFGVTGASTVVSYRDVFRSLPALRFNRCLWIPPSESRLLQTPDKPPYSRLTQSPIESAYTCNHMLQPSDRSIPSLNGRDMLSPSAVAPCTLNIVFRYTWTHFT